MSSGGISGSQQFVHEKPPSSSKGKWTTKEPSKKNNFVFTNEFDSFNLTNFTENTFKMSKDHYLQNWNQIY